MRLAATILLFCCLTAGAEILPSDRSLNWTNLSGVVGGIPYRSTVFVNVLTTTNLAYRCAGDGVTDDAPALWQAIGNCPSNQVVYVPQANYFIGSSVGLPFATAFVVRGDGPGKTRLIGNDRIFVFGGSQSPSPTVHAYLAADSVKGALSLEVTNASGMAAGQMWCLDELNDTNFVWAVNAAYDLDGLGTRCLMNMVYVTNVTGTTVSFDRPLVWGFRTNLAARLSLMTDVNNAPASFHVENIGLENLSLVLTGATSSDKVLLDLYHGRNCWLTNVSFENVGYYGVLLDQCMNCSVVHCEFGPAQVLRTASRGYGVWTWRSSYMLVEDNISHDMTAPFIMPICVGSVMSYNFATNTPGVADPGWLGGDIVPGHGAGTAFNLVEGNVCSMFSPDNYYGSASHLTAFRNHFRGADTNATLNIKCVDIGAGCYSNNLIGNVIGNATTVWTAYEATNTCDIIGGTDKVPYRIGFTNMGNDVLTDWDVVTLQSLIRHGNYDYFTGSTVWDPTIADQDLPPSYYLPGKPAWWGSGAWPPIGPDCSPRVGVIPALTRYTATVAPRVSIPRNVAIRGGVRL